MTPRRPGPTLPVMKKLILLTAILALSSTMLPAQPYGPGPGHRMYDPKTVQTVTGTIVSVDTVTGGGRGMHGGGGIHLTLQTSTQKLDVMLGPSWYINELETKFAAGDVIDVKGSLVNDFLVAGEIKKGADTITLRDVNGVPVWAGSRCR